MDTNRKRTLICDKSALIPKPIKSKIKKDSIYKHANKLSLQESDILRSGIKNLLKSFGIHDCQN